MPRGDNVPFECPRCNYTTLRKDHMKKHLNKKKICPSVKGDIELTDEIQNIVLTKRIFHESKQNNPQLPTTTVINNYNNTTFYTVMNMLNSTFTPIQMVNTYAKYHQIEHTSFDDFLDNTFGEMQCSLDNDPCCSIELREDDLFEVIDEISSVKDNHEDMNVFYDAKDDTINIYEDDAWISAITSKGLKTIIEKLQEYYLDYYECFLINKIHKCENAHEKQRLRELVVELYTFIAAFDVKPYVHGRRDARIIKDIVDERSSEISDSYYDMYISVKNEQKDPEKKRIKKNAKDIIKRKTDAYMQSLKNQMSHLFCSDNAFKDFMQETIQRVRSGQSEIQ